MTPGRRMSVQLGALIVALGSATAVVSAHHTAAACSGPRWPVKTLADPAARYVGPLPQAMTVAHLAGLSLPAVAKDSGRVPQVETRLVQISVEFVAGKLVHDGDLQLVVRDPGGATTMIAELPDAACLGKGVSGRDKSAMVAARAVVQHACPPFRSKNRPLTGKAVLTGVQFHDTPHAGDAEADNARGAARDEVEVHPVLQVTDLTCRAGAL